MIKIKFATYTFLDEYYVLSDPVFSDGHINQIT